MGISFSSGTRRNQNHRYHHHHPSYYHTPPPQPPPPPPPPPAPPYYYASSTDPTNNNYAYTGQYNYHQYPPAVPPNYHYPGWQNGYNYANPMVARPNVPSFYGNGWVGPESGPGFTAPPPYVEHQNAKVVKNDVNVHKDTIRLEVDENHPDHYLVSFVFDAHFDGSITIYYFTKEDEESCKFAPAYPEGPRPVKISFKNGLGKRFRQPSGTGVDLGFYELEDLAKPSVDNVYPLVIFAEVQSLLRREDDVSGSSLETSPRVQVTQAVIEKKREDSFEVKVHKQILWIDGVRYEVRELYGIGNSSESGFNDDDPGKACVICMTEPKDTAVMPCRHLCMCSDCAKELRLQSNKCPICRQPITELIEIKINNSGQ